MVETVEFNQETVMGTILFHLKDNLCNRRIDGFFFEEIYVSIVVSSFE
ncbi:hypothetical protein QY95_04017 [Bacillus thermotolerans]|uniref:Uncharacterized protein n=1 Tax=Bacillus thermotolerans TaxID=1221996 RepID=A0A0F5HLG7_BACTR|nr:hypothetical protein QY95_04017 [Bacillus thermotolerans]